MNTAATAPDPRAEALLERYGCDFHVDEIDVDGVTLNETAATVRAGGIDVDAVARYADAMADGQALPMAIVYNHDDAAEILGGCHRWHAYETNDVTSVQAYLITSELTDLERAAIAIEDNRLHGVSVKTADRIRHALDLMAKGMTEVDAAGVAGVSKSALSRANGAERGRRRAATARCAATYAELPASTQARLVPLADDDVFAEAVRTAARLDLNTAEVEQLLAVIRDAGDDIDDQLDAVETFEEEASASIRSTGGVAPAPVRGTPQRRNLSAWWRTAALSLLEDGPAEDVARDCPNDFRVPMAELAERLATRATEISKELR